MLNSEFILDVQLYCSFGTFGFWSAYLKPKWGEVVISSSYYGLGNMFPDWKIISDPCLTELNLNSVQELTPDCLGKEIEYGI